MRYECMNTEVYSGMSKELLRKYTEQRIGGILIKQGMTIGEFAGIFSAIEKPLTEYTTEELQAEIDRRKSPHGNADLEK